MCGMMSERDGKVVFSSYAVGIGVRRIGGKRKKRLRF